MRNCRYPSITIWPASVPVTVELWPAAIRAIANNFAATLVPRNPGNNLYASFISTTVCPFLKKTVQCDGEINSVPLQRTQNSMLCSRNFSCLNKCRMEVQVMRHYGGADHSDSNVQCLTIWKCGNKSSCYFSDAWLCKNDFD